MAGVRYTAYEKKRAGGRLVWGVLRLEGRKQQFRSVGEGESARRKAEELARKLTELEAQTSGDPDRFLSWHHSGELLPLDRAVRDYARTAQQTVALSTATRYRQFAERLAARLGATDLARLQQEDVGRFVRDEYADGRAPDPTINACVLLRGTILAALRTKDELPPSSRGRPVAEADQDRAPHGEPGLAAEPRPGGIRRRLDTRRGAHPPRSGDP